MGGQSPNSIKQLTHLKLDTCGGISPNNYININSDIALFSYGTSVDLTELSPKLNAYNAAARRNDCRVNWGK